MRSDAALLAAARTDAGAFRELYDRYAERVLGYHLRRCRDEDAARVRVHRGLSALRARLGRETAR